MIARLAFTIARVVCPSIPRHLAAVIAATHTPGPVSGGEADTGPGHSPEGEGAPTCVPPVRAVVSEQVTPRPPATNPVVLVSWHADRASTYPSDTHLAELVGRWTKEVR